ncbi:MAG: response regulator [Thermodesulfovibrionales bacterium]
MLTEKNVYESLILYAEDEPTASETLIYTLNKKGFKNIIHVTNGIEGINAFKTEPPSIIITDIMMPEMDGLTMSEEIRKINPSIPIIITSAFSDVKYLLRPIEIGVDGFLIKPVKNKELTDMIVKLIRSTLLEKEAQKEKVLESIGLLASGFAHDFNNLLTPILGNISLAKSLISPDNMIYRYLENAERSSEDARILVKRFLSFAKGFDLFKTNVFIDSIIKDAVQHNVSQHVHCHLDLKENFMIEVDSGLIYQCISNILKNACEAMPEGGDLYISVDIDNSINPNKQYPNDTQYLKISIRDTGIGIDDQTLTKIFEPYFTTKKMDSNRGTGLGLSIAYSIIKAHKGFITVDSAVNKGSTFNIYLPFSPAPIT